MAIFEYTAVDSSGREFTGLYRNVTNVSELESELARIGCALVRARKNRKYADTVPAKIKQSEIACFAYEFAEMISAGLPIVDCLEACRAQTAKPEMKSVLGDITHRVKSGVSLAEAFGQHKNVFSPLFIGMVRAGQAGRSLQQTLTMAGEYLEKQADLRNRIKSAFAYPVVVTVMCLVITAALVVFVIPVFENLYTRLNVPLPLPTLVLILISNMVRSYWLFMVLLPIVLYFTIRRLCGSAAIKSWLDSFMLRIPVLGGLISLVLVCRFVRTLAVMLSAGVGIIESLALAAGATGNVQIDDAASAMRDEVISGRSLSECMSRMDIFPDIVTRLAGAGEQAGTLPKMLVRAAELLDTRIDRQVKSLITKVEPALSIITGIIVAGILLGVYLPMFDYMGRFN